MKECIEIQSIIDSRPFVYMLVSALQQTGHSICLFTDNKLTASILDENGYCAVRNIDIIEANQDTIEKLYSEVKNEYDFCVVDNMEISANTKYICLLPFIVDDVMEYDINIKNEKNAIIVSYGKSLAKKKPKKSNNKNGEVWELYKAEDAVIESLNKSTKITSIPDYNDLVGFERAGKLITLSKQEANFICDYFSDYIIDKKQFIGRLMKKHECTIKTNSSILW